MKIPYRIIKQWAKFRGTPEELRSLIDLHITEVEDIVESGKFSRVVVGEILEITPHPNADKLRLTKTKVGENEVLAIVCGAKNIAVGQKVPVALPGAVVANGMTIQATNIRGEDSFGMLCSGSELGFTDTIDGVMVLDKEIEIGTPLAQVFDENGDIAFDLKVLANRPDYMSWLSVAREVAAAEDLGFTYKLPTEYSETRKHLTAQLLTVKQAAKADEVPRYMARVVKGVTVEPSPTWLQDLLTSVGLRPINNLVDAANLVMLETGQPIHIFDLNKINKASLTVRMAKAGETIETLDDQTRKLSAEDLVIVDHKGPVAIAGIIGGKHSGVTEVTTDIAIEVANFNRKTIRMSSKRLGVRTDASARFERGVDVHLAPTAMARLLNLISELSPKAQIAKGVHDLHNTLPPATNKLTFNLEKVKQIADLPLTNNQIVKILSHLDLPAEINSKSLVVTIPSYRADITREADIAEELIRIHGLDKIISRFPTVQMGAIDMPHMLRLRQRVATLLSRMGGMEVKTHPFFDGDNKTDVALENPLNENWTHLKTNLLHGLMDLEYEGVEPKLFEINKVFHKTKSALPEETTQLAMRIDGKGAYVEARSILATLLLELGVQDDYRELPSKLGLELVVDGNTVGEIIYHTDTTAGFTVNLDKIISSVAWDKTFVEPPKYPGIKFDLALEVNNGIRIGQMHDAIMAAHELVDHVELFDVFQMNDAKRSAAFHVLLRSPERTLTKEDRDAAQTEIVNSLEKKFQAKLR